MNYIGYICTIIGLVLAGIWIAQEFSTLRLLDNPSTGAAVFLLIGFVLRMIARKRSA